MCVNGNAAKDLDRDIDPCGYVAAFPASGQDPEFLVFLGEFGSDEDALREARIRNPLSAPPALFRQVS